jgi:type II secretion system protein G
MKLKHSDKNRTIRSRQHGFTLVELLLVLVILGILAAIVLPRFTNRTKQAQIAATQTQIATFKTALDAYEVDNGYYPKGKNGLMDLIQQPRDAQNWRGPYLQSDSMDHKALNEVTHRTTSQRECSAVYGPGAARLHAD